MTVMTKEQNNKGQSNNVQTILKYQMIEWLVHSTISFMIMNK